MLLKHQKWILWLVHATALLSLTNPAEIPTPCDPNCALLRATECLFLQRPIYECSAHDTHFPPSLAKLLINLPPSFKNSILNGNLTADYPKDLVKVSPSLLNLMPMKLIHFSGESVSAYLQAHPHESSVTIKLINHLNSAERKSFLENWSGNDSYLKIEDIVAIALTKWQVDTDWNFLGLVDSNTTVLLHLPPQFLLTLSSKKASEFLFHLGSKLNSMPHTQVSHLLKSLNLNSGSLKFLQRAWAVLAVRELPDKIKWTKYSFVLPGLTLDELKSLDIDEIKPFLGNDFSAAQVRTIVSKLIVPWHVSYYQVAPWIKYLSPSQIQNLWQSNFKDLGIMANETASYITAKQLLLYQLNGLNNEYARNGKYMNLSSSEDLIKLGGGFVAILPLNLIEKLSSLSALTLDSLLKIDSNLLSLSTAYHLTSESRIFNLGTPSSKLIRLKGMLRAIPTSQIMAINGDMSSLLLHHLLEHLPGDNILRNLELLKKCRSALGNADYVLKYLLKNKDKNDYFSLLSPKDVAHISLSTINSLSADNYGQEVQELPHHILTAILSNNSPNLLTWSNMLNNSNAFYSLLTGLNCNEMRKIAYSDFITIIGRYNDERLKVGKVFPKNLQRCGQLALSDYLLLKSKLFNELELIDLLEPSDIEAVGGYILVSLPAEEILHARYSIQILSAIGQLSLPELFSAASRDHLSSLMDEYLNKDLNITDLLMLRNLIHFIPPSHLEKIKPNDLKYVIESGLIDKRICGDASFREAWSNLLMDAYGSPSTWNASQLESLGDLMIVFSSDRLDTVASSEWQLLADIAVTKYTESIEWPKTSTFYQACLSTLIKPEQNRYSEAVKSLLRKYFMEVQKLSGSIELNIKESVSVKINESSWERLLKPQEIFPGVETNEPQETYDENVIQEIPSEFQPEQSENSQPGDLYQSPKMKTSTPVEITSAQSVNIQNETDSEIVAPSVGNQSSNDSDNSPYHRNKEPVDSNEEQILKESGESAVLEEDVLSPHSANLPSITEVSTRNPPQNETTPARSYVESEQDHDVSPEFIVPHTVIQSQATSYAGLVPGYNPGSEYGNDLSNVSYLPVDTFSEDDEDDDIHVGVFGPQAINVADENNANGNEDVSSMEVDQVVPSPSPVPDESHKQVTGEASEVSTTLAVPGEKPKSIFDGPNLFARLWDIPATLSTSTENYASTSEKTSEVSSGSVLESDSSSAADTSDFEVSDHLGALFFGHDFAKEFVNLRKGAKQLFGSDKSKESPITPETTTDSHSSTSIVYTEQTVASFENTPVTPADVNCSAIIDNSPRIVANLKNIPVVTANSNCSSTLDNTKRTAATFNGDTENLNLENGEKLLVAKEEGQSERVLVPNESEKLFAPKDAEQSADLTTTDFLATTIGDTATPSSEMNFATNSSKPVTIPVPSASASTPRQQNIDFVNIDSLDIINFDPDKIVSIDELSEVLDADFEQPHAEVYDKEGVSVVASDEDDSTYSNPNEAFQHSAHSIPDATTVDLNLNFHEATSELSLSDIENNRHGRFRRGFSSASSSVFCDSVRVLGKSAGLALREFDLHTITNEELLNCVEDLGKLDLPQTFKEVIWQRIKSLGVVDMAMGTLVGAWKLDDVNSMNLIISEDWNLEIIHLISKHNQDTLVAKAVVEKMRKQIFVREAISEVPEAVTVAMGPLLCLLDISELQLMFQTPGTFMHVIPIIGRMMQGCPSECLSKFAKLAVIFMDPPDLWTSDMVALLGPIPAGLDDDNWRLLATRPQIVSGLQPRALECLPQSFLQIMGVEALAVLPPLTTKALTDKQLKSLNKQQTDVLINIKNERWSLRNISVLLRFNADKTPKPNVEVHSSSNCISFTPVIIIVCFFALISS